MPAGLPQRVHRLVGRDGIEPRAERPAVLEQAPLEVDLKERVLEDIFRQAGIAQVAGEVAVQLALVPMDEFGEDIGVPLLAVTAHQLLIGELTEAFRRIRSYGLNHLTFRRGQRFRTSAGEPAPPYLGRVRDPHASRGLAQCVTTSLK